MNVQIDQAWADDLIGTVNNLGVMIGLQIGVDRINFTVGQKNVGDFVAFIGRVNNSSALKQHLAHRPDHTR